MFRGRQTFKQGDVTKALKGAVNAGLSVKRVGIGNGKIIVDPAPSVVSGNGWDDVR
jgi:hypothetical protein